MQPHPPALRNEIRRTLRDRVPCPILVFGKFVLRHRLQPLVHGEKESFDALFKESGITPTSDGEIEAVYGEFVAAGAKDVVTELFLRPESVESRHR